MSAQPDPLPLLAIALDYAARGWPVLPVYYPRPDGSCSCGQAHCTSIGKHPSPPHGLKMASTTTRQITSWWQHVPQANIAIRTGAAANLVVLDIDTKHDGTSTLHDLEARYGALPPTLTARTGSGGTHYLFQHPGGRVRNDASGFLGAGVDVRGDGGYIVAPPSLHVSGRHYHWLTEHPIAALSAAWVALLPRPIERLPNTNTLRLVPQESDGAYWLDQYLLRARSGNRNEMGFRLAQQLRDSGYGESDAADYLRQYARRQASDYTEQEALHSLRSAYSKPAREPARSREAGAPLLIYSGGRLVNQETGEVLEDGTIDDGTLHEGPDDPEEQSTIKPYPLISGGALLLIPKPEELITGWLLKAPTAMLYARAGIGKTAVAMDMGLCIASGNPWHGHRVLAGPVLYIAAEGGYGMGIRYGAWLSHYNDGQIVDDFHVIPTPVMPTYRGTLERLRYTIALHSIHNPVAIFVDTLAQCFGDGDEIDNHDSQVFLTAVVEIAQQTGATVILIHHSGWDETRMRGASNFRNSIDSVLQLKSTDVEGRATLRPDKIKDLEPPRPIEFERVKVQDSFIMRPMQGGSGANLALTEHQHAVLQVLATATFNGSSSSEIQAATALTKTTLFRIMSQLAIGNMVTSTGEKYRSGQRHHITEGGRKALDRCSTRGGI